MIFFFWGLILLILGFIARLIYVQVKPRNKTESAIKKAVLGALLVFAFLSLLGMFRYQENLPKPHNITEDTPLRDRLRVAQASNALGRQLDKLVKDKNLDVRLTLAGNPYLDEDYAEILFEDSEPAVRKRITRNNSVPISMIEEMMEKETDVGVRDTMKATLKYREEQAKGNTSKLPSAPDPTDRITDALDLLDPESEEYSKIRRAIAEQPFLYSVDSLASDPNPDVRYAAASNPKMSTQVLNQLLEDNDHGVRLMAAITLAKKKNVQKRFLDYYSLHENAFVRRAVASNERTPSHILDQLSKDNVVIVVKAVAENPNTTPDVLKKLAGSEDVEVRRRVARHRNADDAVLRLLSRDSDSEVRRRVALNPNARGILLTWLSEDEEETIRQAVAHNSSTTPFQLMNLSDDSSAKVRLGVASNPNSAKELLEKLAQDPDSAVRAQADRTLRSFDLAIKNLNKDSSVYARRQVAQNVDTPEKILSDLARDPDPHVRERVAFNPNTPTEAIKQLLRDPEEHVRIAAQENPNRPYSKDE